MNLSRLFQILPVHTKLIKQTLVDELELLRIGLQLFVRGELLFVRDGERTRRSGCNGRGTQERIDCSYKRLDARRQVLRKKSFRSHTVQHPTFTVQYISVYLSLECSGTRTPHYIKYKFVHTIYCTNIL